MTSAPVQGTLRATEVLCACDGCRELLPGKCGEPSAAWSTTRYSVCDRCISTLIGCMCRGRL